ncbi:hypothetical protein DVA86_27345 [Streptomyces armeniacus]|uniref:Uncharacterized protein n=1 Tax=Streptomyces armeniacus TaxID=83291 RepID=A0A345XVX7_9ACTN|nr:hypothetical protein [Streptomyces armeniacus]AXK35793.1 hypothetical protein DVA86_27345 [Streptomyces armeniacus]
MSRTDDYWPTIGGAVIVYIDSIVHQEDRPTARAVITMLRTRYGFVSLLDFAAVLVMLTAQHCPAVPFRRPDGRPDAVALTHCRREEARLVLDGLQPINRDSGQPEVAIDDLTRTNRPPAHVRRARVLIDTALQAAPPMGDVVAALRPAADSPRAMVVVTALATIALRKVTSRTGGAPG